jgi:hypothetical protein
MAYTPDGNIQNYKATVTLNWSSEVFEGDPDDVFELAALEEKFLAAVLDTAAIALNPVDAVFDIVSIEPVLEP